MINIDFHTHSVASSDGGITAKQYEQVIASGLLNCIAVTDHNETALAQQLHAKLGDAIIVGEEITTTKGELIGLFLQETIAPGQAPLATAQAIKDQGGLVYVPHPFETRRKGLQYKTLAEIAELVDIVEAFNGRAFFQDQSVKATIWACQRHKAQAVASDAHGIRGLGYAFTSVETLPTAATLPELLTNAYFTTRRAPLVTLLYPKLNCIKNKFNKRHL